MENEVTLLEKLRSIENKLEWLIEYELIKRAEAKEYEDNWYNMKEETKDDE
jgi:hypothetical protein